jgi:hypothetical protein
MTQIIHLSLNLPALERLIGNDTELEVNLRQQIVDNFADKHLKSLLNSDGLLKLKLEWEQLIRSELSEKLKELKSQPSIIQCVEEHVSNDTKWHLGRLIQETVAAAINETLQSLIDRQKRWMEDRVKAAVDAALPGKVDRLIEQGIQDRLKAAAALVAGQQPKQPD